MDHLVSFTLLYYFQAIASICFQGKSSDKPNVLYSDFSDIIETHFITSLSETVQNKELTQIGGHQNRA